VESHIGSGAQWFGSGLITGFGKFDFDVKPYAPWTMTKALPLATKDVWMDLALMGNDDPVDINPKPGKSTLILDYSPTTGQVGGDDLQGNVGPNARFTSKGAGDCPCGQVTVSVSNIVGTCLK